MIHDPDPTSGPLGSLVLGRSGLRTSKLVLGTMTFGKQADEETSHAMLDAAYEAGVRHFDTANVYNAGQAERILGRWLAARQPNDVVVATKLRYPMPDEPMSLGLSRRTIREQLEASLRRLGVEVVDLLYLHQPDDETDLAITLRVCNDLLAAGRIHAYGLSNFAAWQTMKAHWLCDRLGLEAPLVMQPMYNLIARGIEAELLPCCADLGLVNLVYNPLAAGLLTGKHHLDAEPEATGRFGLLPYYKDRYWNEAAFHAVDQLSRLATNHGLSLLSLALRWPLCRPGIHGLILGASSPAQLEQNLAALAGEPLSEELLAGCDEIWAELRGHTPRYHR